LEADVELVHELADGLRDILEGREARVALGALQLVMLDVLEMVPIGLRGAMFVEWLAALLSALVERDDA